MAQNAPPSIDVPDIQFKLHDKFQLFEEANLSKNYVSLVDTSHNTNLLFVGNPLKPELKVFKLQEIVNRKYNDLPNINNRVVPLAGCPLVLACSNDGSMLAIHYMLNSTGFLQIMQTASFLTPSLVTLYSLPISAEHNVFALQLLWNPVLSNSMALITSDGAATILNFTTGGQYDIVTLNRDYQVNCGCWSPKGKQIVLGFADGKLQQFKPNLTPARVLTCPPNIHPAPFDTVAVHWLSTYQFAAVFLQRQADTSPFLFIINAPKGGTPQYINYYDICYSAPGPRHHQINFLHVQQWNLLLVTSANGVEVGILGAQGQGDNPNWIQYNLLDEARIELPLTDSKEETYPMGFALDTSCTHQLIVKEAQLPIMPMIHLISTHGQLISFDFLNLTPGINGICSPPPPAMDKSGQFHPLQIKLAGEKGVQVTENAYTSTTTTTTTNNNNNNMLNNQTFDMNCQMMTSTPAIKDKPLPLFGGNLNPNIEKSNTDFIGATVGTNMANTSTNKMVFGNAVMPTGTVNNTFTKFAVPAKIDEGKVFSNANDTNINKPLYTVSSTFVPPKSVQPAIKYEMNSTQSLPGPGPSTATTTSKDSNGKLSLMSNDEIDTIVNHIIGVQMDGIEKEIQHCKHLSNNLMNNLGRPEEMKGCTTSLHNMQEILQQAYGQGIQQDIENLRHSMNESYVMFSECRFKLELFNNPDLSRLTTTANANPANRRQIMKLKSYVSSNEAYLQQLQQLLDFQWSEHQDVVRRNSQHQMHIPCLNGIYQKMSKLKDMMADQRNKIAQIKHKLQQNGLHMKGGMSNAANTPLNSNVPPLSRIIESTTDLITNMNLNETVFQTQAKLPDDKLEALHNFTKQHKIVNVIRPKRPDRVGLKSEVILETKLQKERKEKIKQATDKTKDNESMKVKGGQQQERKTTEVMMAAPMASDKSKNTVSAVKTPPFSSASNSANNVKNINPWLVANTNNTANSMPKANTNLTTLNFGQNVKVLPAKTILSAPSSDTKPKPVTLPTATAPVSFTAKVIQGNQSNQENKNVMSSNASDSNKWAANKPQTQAVIKDNTFAMKTENNKPMTQVFGASNFTNSANIANFAAKASTQQSTPPTTSTFSPSTTASGHDAGVFGNAKGVPLFGKNAQSVTHPFPAINTPPVGGIFTGKTNDSNTIFSGKSDANTNKLPASSTAGGSATSFSFTKAEGEGAAAAPFTFGQLQKTSDVSAAVKDKDNKANVPAANSTFNADTFLGSLNICTPSAELSQVEAPKPATNLPANIFSGLAAQNTTITPFSFNPAVSGAEATKQTTPFAAQNTNSNFTFGSKANAGATTAAGASGGFSFTGNAGLNQVTKSNATSSSSSTTVGTTRVTIKDPHTTITPIPGPSAPATTATAVLNADTAATKSNAFTFGGGSVVGFGALNLMNQNVSSTSSSTATTAAAATTTTTTTPNPVSSTTITSTVTSSTGHSGGDLGLGGLGLSKPNEGAGGVGSALGKPVSIFGGISNPTATSAPILMQTTVNTTLTSTAPPTANIFGGIPKQDSTVSSSTSTNIFGSNPAPVANSNNNNNANSGGNMFGAGFSFATPTTTGNFFSGGGKSSTTNIFGSPTAVAAGREGMATNENTNIFGSPTAGNNVVSGDNLFSKGSFSAATGNAAAGGGGPATSGSVFGASGDNAFQASRFSSFAQPTAASGGSLFGGSSANSNNAFGFGSPQPSQPQQQSAFSKPVFGGAPTFGSPPPAFGAQPTFGGAPTFSSPKGFTSFASSPNPGVAAPNTANTAPAFGGAANPSSTGNIFEALGSSNSALSFGNLAESTQKPAQAKPAPTFGGSSFMNYRS